MIKSEFGAEGGPRKSVAFGLLSIEGDWLIYGLLKLLVADGAVVVGKLEEVLDGASGATFYV